MNLNQVTLPSKDVARSMAFYEKLGLTLIVNALPHYIRFECPKGSASFSIHLTEHVIQNTGAYIYFECDNLDEYVSQLTQQGIVFDEMPNDKNWLWREARLKDPDGNQLILYFAGENRLNPPWKVDKNQDL